ncbi:hypothetical protein [Methanobrevibacter sp.]|uniref:hypothetical protein n=1 Tax=Methanobrevibacter sp. TaxID=66852 RepID=UPI0025ED9E45|nr:hypothetical protein [Methanobrevibacter sp.]MBQ2666675.1 hypothetical protein [Methanobrevibacter sp.]
MKDTIILLIFLLSVLGLFIGVYYTEDVGSDNSHESGFERVYEENGSVLTITLEKENGNWDKDFT